MAADPKSLAGKVLRHRASPPPLGRRRRRRPLLGGRGRRRPWCIDPRRRASLYRRPTALPPADRLQADHQKSEVSHGCGPWPDKPGVAGCAAMGRPTVLINLLTTKLTVAVRMAAVDRLGHR